ncbi:hypothetical protein QBC33DRAFT_512707 [Phialemonium atrogriseum]|uniref:Uncharacterized protein n=1 Tax=Phialemonium atrogriseum TaxID=1093897 RepID=A0AAJ0FRE0_9PEZI|nr:uncharacterized protein QBC33DRAFT_512707 [Phialemonium atrogriseum]KAK1770040.1 hypothetical protein QBC33DRAFT_512707 [Phialemonium atrogriseum]
MGREDRNKDRKVTGKGPDVRKHLKTLQSTVSNKPGSSKKPKPMAEGKKATAKAEGKKATAKAEGKKATAKADGKKATTMAEGKNATPMEAVADEDVPRPKSPPGNIVELAPNIRLRYTPQPALDRKNLRAPNVGIFVKQACNMRSGGQKKFFRNLYIARTIISTFSTALAIKEVYRPDGLNSFTAKVAEEIPKSTSKPAPMWQPTGSSVKLCMYFALDARRMFVRGGMGPSGAFLKNVLDATNTNEEWKQMNRLVDTLSELIDRWLELMGELPAWATEDGKPETAVMGDESGEGLFDVLSDGLAGLNLNGIQSKASPFRSFRWVDNIFVHPPNVRCLFEKDRLVYASPNSSHLPSSGSQPALNDDALLRLLLSDRDSEWDQESHAGTKVHRQTRGIDKPLSMGDHEYDEGCSMEGSPNLETASLRMVSQE